MKTLSLQLRFLLPLVITLVIAAYVAQPLLDKVTLRWFARDLNSRGVLVANALSDSVTQALEAGRPRRLLPLFERSVQGERLFAIGVCSPDGRMLERSRAFPADLTCERSLRLAAGHDQGQAAARDHPDLLAHPVAQPRVVRDLPLAARDPAGHAG